MGDTSESQIVVSQSAASCMLNAVAKSSLGNLDLNEKRIMQWLNVTDIKFDTTNMEKHFPILTSKIGKKKPLKIRTSISDVNVILGAFDCDIHVEYTLKLGWYLDLLGSPELLYDEIRMISSFNVKTHDDYVDVLMIDNKIKMDAQFGGR